MSITTRKVLLALDYKYEHNGHKVLEAIRNKEMIEDSDIPNIEEDSYTTCLDDDYPQIIKDNRGIPPFVITHIPNLKLNDYVGKTLLIGDNTLGLTDYLNIKGTNIYCGEELIIFGFTIENCIMIATTICGKVFISNKSMVKGTTIINSSLAHCKEIYVQPTSKPSYNNSLIKDGANLCDTITDLDN